MTTIAKDKLVHHICRTLRELRIAAGLSLAEVEARYGVNSVALGSYERGDRVPPLTRAEHILNQFGYTLAAIPINSTAVRIPADMAADLRAIADQLEAKSAVSRLSHTVAPAARLCGPAVVHMPASGPAGT